MEEKLLAITKARAQTRDHAPARPAVDLEKRWNKPLLGNRLSQIYHTPAQKNYGNINPKNQVRFWTERDAQKAGYRRAANDHHGPGTGVARTERKRTGTLASQFQRLARQLTPDDALAHGDLNVRLRDEERERAQGMSF